jgi:hypothetical protein
MENKSKLSLIFLLIVMVALVSLIGCTQIHSVPVEVSGLTRLQITVRDTEGIPIFNEDQMLKPNTNAFEAVKELIDNNLTYKEYDFGVFVESILGITPKEDEFWSLYVNGEQAAQGISSYTISEDMLIEFKLEKINFDE